MNPNFEDDKDFSVSENIMAKSIIISMLHGVIRVDDAGSQDDIAGVDYWAILGEGRRVGIDDKLRRDCVRYWPDGKPQVSLEIWSKVPSDGKPGKIGWTLDQHKRTEYVMFRFSDYKQVFLFPFRLLQMAMARNIVEWSKIYQICQQDNGSYKSESIFVPATIVAAAIVEAMSI